MQLYAPFMCVGVFIQETYIDTINIWDVWVVRLAMFFGNIIYVCM